MRTILTIALFALLPATVFAETYTYDARGRIATARYDDGSEIRFTWDQNGNLVHREVIPAVVSPDAGVSDAGGVDSGVPDAGRNDAGRADAGRADAGGPTADAGRADAAVPAADGGGTSGNDPGKSRDGCGCSVPSQPVDPARAVPALLIVVGLALRRRR